MVEWEEYLSPPPDMPTWVSDPEDYPCWVLSSRSQTYGGVVHRIAGGYDAYGFAGDYRNDVRDVFDTLKKAKMFVETHIINGQRTVIEQMFLKVNGKG